MTIDAKNAKELTLVVIEYIKSGNTAINNHKKIIRVLETNKFGVFSAEFIETFYNKKVNAYIFNNVVIPKFKVSVGWETIFIDSLLFNTFLNDNYNKELVSKVEPFMPEGPYGYLDGDFKVLVEPNDIVIDAGAYIGDFSAYAASKGATCYAFEPLPECYEMLCKTNKANTNKFYPVKYGLGDKIGAIPSSSSGISSSIYFGKEIGGVKPIKNLKTETINITTLDKFVEENNIVRVDFIKSDIEGAERDMLIGAKNVLKTFAPKLAICTYHFPDDPEVLKNIILQANPKYRIVQLRKKLYACV